VAQLGANAFGEVLEPGRVPDCYLGLRLDPDDDARRPACWWSPRLRCCIRSCRSRMAPYCTSC
jgi:hypothetical protein